MKIKFQPSNYIEIHNTPFVYMIETTMTYNINGSRIGSSGIVRGRCRSSGRGGHNKIHNKSYNSTMANKYGFEQLKGFDFDNTVSNSSDNFRREIESTINYIGSEYRNSKNIVHIIKRR